MTIGKENQFQNNFLPFIRVGIGILSVLFLSVIVSRLVYPFGGGTWEAFSWMPAAHLLEAKNPYAFAFAPPYSMSPYGIVFYGLIAVGVALFGFQMWFGRILSVGAFIVCVSSVTKITGRITRGREAALFACLAALAMFPSQLWVAVMRADLIAAAFAFAALRLVFTLEEDEKISLWRIAQITFFALAAFFTKQSLVLPVIFIFLRFLQLKKWRAAVWFALAFAVPAVAGMFLLDYTSAGGYFWQHFTHAQRLPYTWSRAVSVFIEMLKMPAFFFSMIFLLAVAFEERKFFKRKTRRELSEIVCSPRFLIVIYFLISLVVAFVSTIRIGSSANYYIENSFVLAIVCGLIYENFRRNARSRLCLAMIALLILGGAFQQARVLRGEYVRWQSLDYYREIYQKVGQLTPAGSECVSINPELVVWNRCRFHFDDFEEYYGDWSPELNEIFAREVASGRYAAIVWYDDKLHLRFPNYKLVPMSQKLPEKFLPAFLYVRDTQPSE